MLERWKKWSSQERRTAILLGGLGLTILTLLVIVFGSLIVYNDIVLQAVVPRSGTVLEVDANSVLDGLELTIPENAFTREAEIVIRSQPLDRDAIGDIVSPITPLITIEHPSGYSDQSLVMSIPIDIDTDTEFAMAFFYDEDSGDLEAIPMIGLTDRRLIIQSRYYTSLFVSKISLAELHAMTTDGNAIDTGYQPGVDDWSFPNYGSALAPGGHCAGMALTSAYYYVRHATEGEPSLNERFDNGTPDIWYDDAVGIRYASVIQSAIDFTSDAYRSMVDTLFMNDARTYYAFKYAMYVTGDPQLVGIYSYFGPTIISGHAILVYKVEEGRIYVADPNFPADDERYIPYGVDANMFGIYQSGDNAATIDAIGTIDYDTFFFIGLSALVDFDDLDEQYARVLDGTIGQFRMPSLELDYMSGFSYVDDDIVWSSIDDTFALPAGYNASLPPAFQNKLRLRGTIDENTVVYTIFLNDQFYRTDILPSDGTYFVIELDIEPGDNVVAVLAEVVIGGNLRYADYREFTYTLPGFTGDISNDAT